MGSKSTKDITAYRRRAHHAGSWYSFSKDDLATTLQDYLDTAGTQMTLPTQALRAIICPHAGYSYSGPTAAFSYRAVQHELQGSRIDTILVLHPSHHVYLKGCAVSGANILETPVGNLPVATSLRDELCATGHFDVMERRVDEEEHSGEMQYPFLAQIMPVSRSIPVLPVMCGALSTADEMHYGAILRPIIRRPNVLTVMSSDFCHWGSRFRYQPTSDGLKPHEWIRQLDHQSMEHIEMQNPGAFAEYLKQTQNTICGRHAISVWLRAIAPKDDLEVSFVKYAQSSAAMSLHDSSVSYAAAVVTQKS